MEDEGSRITDPLAAEPQQEEDAPKGPLRVFFGLFLVPLLVVLACVAVFIGFGWIAYERGSTRDYVNDLRSGWKPRRAQAAYELAKILVADPTALDEEPGVKEEVREMFRTAESDDLKRYLALVLGYTGDPEAVPLLVASLDDPSSELRIYALYALGSIGDPRALEPVTAALRDADAGIRKTAAFALGELGDPAAVPALRGMLRDTVADVRWNAALSLARLGSAEGAAVLREMLDRQLAGQVPGISPEQQEDAMVNAVAALAAVEGDAALDVLQKLAERDPSLKVRQAALEALEALRGSDTGQ